MTTSLLSDTLYLGLSMVENAVLEVAKLLPIFFWMTFPVGTLLLSFKDIDVVSREGLGLGIWLEVSISG